ncbi:MAG TPA: hypothetical protein VFI08_03785, partial [Spirochaetia bacterium]|nr:hypothetical protein [Spirochaetia bacterium]
GAQLGQPDPSADDGAAISHGICDECVDFLLGNDRLSLSSFLDSLPMPVVLVDARGGVIMSNQRARRSFACAGGSDAEPCPPPADAEEGRVLLGQLLECCHAASAQGCGRTVHCASCQIRRSVESTYCTGRRLEYVPAHRDAWGPGGGRNRTYLRISTEKLGHAVLLRIEAVAQPVA